MVDKTDLKSVVRMGVWVQVPLRVHNGDLVQLARTLDLHSRGRGFESHFLHQKKYAGVAEQMGSTTIRRA